MKYRGKKWISIDLLTNVTRNGKEDDDRVDAWTARRADE